jgi:hypothetical protein
LMKEATEGPKCLKLATNEPGQLSLMFFVVDGKAHLGSP